MEDVFKGRHPETAHLSGLLWIAAVRAIACRIVPDYLVADSHIVHPRQRGEGALHERARQAGLPLIDRPVGDARRDRAYLQMPEHWKNSEPPAITVPAGSRGQVEAAQIAVADRAGVLAQGDEWIDIAR